LPERQAEVPQVGAGLARGKTRCLEVSGFGAKDGTEAEKEGEEMSEKDAALRRIADAITPNLVPATDATGGGVASLTEAVMGMTAALCSIADALRDIAEEIKDSQEKL
jgi:hypothetical protein